MVDTPATLHAEPLRFHAPAWTVVGDAASYWLWAPNDRRSHWAAAWEGPGGYDGNLRRAATPEEALAVLTTCPHSHEALTAARALLDAATDTTP